jgi:SAM-dependent methyltransferase
MRESIYVLGHSQAEIRRLINQATILRPTTERLLRSAGIKQGMRVLDVGCGAGDVSMLAGKLVGASGSVVGIDLNADILAVARDRSPVDGFTNVTFTEASVGTFAGPIPFDLVIARYVFRARTPSWDAAGRMIENFSGAGLAQPELFSEVPVGGGVDAPHYAWFAGVARTLLPQMIQAVVETVAKSRGRRQCVRGLASAVDSRDIHSRETSCQETRIARLSPGPHVALSLVHAAPPAQSARPRL